MVQWMNKIYKKFETSVRIKYHQSEIQNKTPFITDTYKLLHVH